MSNITVKQAAFLTGKSRQTINDATKNGLLTFTKNTRGHKVIDVSELNRVFEIVKSMDELTQSNSVRSDSKTTVKKKTISNNNIERLEKALSEQKIQSLEKEVEIKNEAIEQWQKAFEKAQSTADKITALLEHQSSQNLKTDKIDTLEKMVREMKAQNDDLLAKEKMRRERQAERKLQRESVERTEKELLIAEANKTIWQKLFG